MQAWQILTGFGDTNVTMPVAAGIFLWLAAGRAGRMTLWWVVLFGGGLVLVAITKIAFIGWGLGIRSLDFTGVSGHAMRAAAVFPVIAYLLFMRRSLLIRMAAFVAGLVVGGMISISRVVVHAHSISEVVTGVVLGVVIAGAFVQISRTWQEPTSGRWIIVLSLLLILPASRLAPAPTERWVQRVALFVSGHDKPYTREAWRTY